jgi:hypothetical protein
LTRAGSYNIIPDGYAQKCRHFDLENLQDLWFPNIGSESDPGFWQFGGKKCLRSQIPHWAIPLGPIVRQRKFDFC